MRILFVHNFYQQHGGEDASALAEKILLEQHGDEVLFYSRHNDEIKNYSIAQKALFFPRAVYSPRTSRELEQLVKQHQPQVAYVNNVFPLISPSLYHTLHVLGVPCIQVLHDFRFLCPNGWFYTHGQICERCKWGNYLNAFRLRCYKDSYTLSGLYGLTLGLHRLGGGMRKITAYVASTNFMKQKFVEVGIPALQIFIKPNFVDPNGVSPNYQQGDYAIFLGRLSSEKGVWTMVKAFERITEIRLKIVGAGSLEGPLRTYLSEKGLHNIELSGFSSGQDKWELLRNCLLSVVPSTCYETFGKTIVESYAAGKCVVGSNLGGIPYVIEDGKSGLVFQPGSEDDLVEKVRFLLARPAEIDRMGRYGRHLAETKYSSEENYRLTREIVGAVTDGLGGKPNGSDKW